MKKVLVIIVAIGFMAVLTSCQASHNCPNYGQVTIEQNNA
ncbi:MAG: lipoprotein [Flavobacteriaceae bacterium]|nr:lipoprotein [Flavobacteriaceae bacterium]